VCYLRENGPIAYGADIFGRDPRGCVEALLSVGLSSYWKTAQDGGVAREWTQLTRWSVAALLADLAAASDAVPPHVLLITVDGSDTPSEITDARVVTWMRGFGAAAAGPLHAVVSRPAAGGGDLLFVAQQPPETVRALLHAWGIHRDSAERRAYARLRGNALEDLVRSLTHP
jgi:hypothetical protein